MHKPFRDSISNSLQYLKEPFVVGFIIFPNPHDSGHKLNPAIVASEEFLQGDGGPDFNGHVLVHVVPGDLIPHEEQGKVPQRLQIILPALMKPSHLIVRGKQASIKHGVTHFEQMPLHIHIPLGPPEIYHCQLPLFIQHKVLRLYVSVQVATFVYKLQRLEDVDEQRLEGKIGNWGAILPHDNKIVLLNLVIVDSVDARPSCLCDVFPHLVVHFNYVVCLWNCTHVLYCDLLVVPLWVTVKYRTELRPLQLVLL